MVLERDAIERYIPADRDVMLEREPLSALAADRQLAALRLPVYEADPSARIDVARELVRSVAAADGLIIASPGYHGGISGLVKNALDYVEDLRTDSRPYLDGRAVGCISTAAGWQAAGSTLQALRAVVHALRGWPTPLGVAINSELPVWSADGTPADHGLVNQLEIVTGQVVEFARRWRGPTPVENSHHSSVERLSSQTS